MRLIKTLQQALKMDREKFKVPRSVQQAIPIQRIWPDGVFQSGTKFSKSFRFSDINYAIASKEDKTEMFLDYSELLNALDSGASAKITLNNRRINKEEFEASLLLPMKEDGLDTYRKEYNEMLLSKVSGTNNSIYQERYLTVSVHKKNIDEARTYFARVGTDIITHLSKLSSIGEELDAEQRLQIFRDFFRADQPQCFPFDMKAFAKRGSSFKDWICPQSMEFSKDCFKINERYGRVLYMQDYASYVKDDMISELCDLSRDLMLSIDILPVPTDEAVREIQNRLLGVETNVTNWQRRQNANNNFSAIVPYDMELQRKETKEMLDDLTTRDQRMMFGILTMVHMADSKKQLDSDTESILSVARKHLCQMATLKWQQVDGLNTVLPYGIRKINALRTLTTESTAVLIPFHTQEIMQPGGIYYGQNAVSKNMLVADRRKLLNGNSFRLGVSGSGKSTLVRDVFYKALKREYSESSERPGEFVSISGDIQMVKDIEFVDQNPIGKSSRSNPVTYVKAYDEIRKLYAEQPLAKQMGYTAGYFSFNTEGGRCEECKGDGTVTVEMQFMADLVLECESCHGKRFKSDTLEVKFQDKNIYDILEMTVNQAIEFFTEHGQKKIVKKLTPLQDVGLGYIKLGQSSSTLSGGENQRVKLAYFLSVEKTQPTIFVFDEPTTGLHFHDIKKLLEAFDALISRGHTIVIIEHNLDVIKCADYVIDLGPEGGKMGGNLVVAGTPEEIAQCAASYTGQFLKEKYL